MVVIPCRFDPDHRHQKNLNRSDWDFFILENYNKLCITDKRCILSCIILNNKVYNLQWITSKENNQRTKDSFHVLINEKGQFVSNYDYTRYSLLPNES